MKDFIESLQGVVTVFEHKGEEKTASKVFASFYEFKENLKRTFMVEYSDTIVRYEDGKGFWLKITTENDFFEAIRWVDGIRFYVKVEFDDSKIIQIKQTKYTSSSNSQQGGPIWSCTRCFTKNAIELQKCSVCSLVKRS